METKLEAAIAYIITGNAVEASKLCNVPDRTIRYWTTCPWWEDILAEAQRVKQKELDAIWTGLIHKAADGIRKRIDQGDATLTKSGEIKYVPIKAKDLAIIMSIATEKRALLRGQPTQRKENVTVEKKLDLIRGALADQAEKKVEIEDNETVH
jgi:hypothetical protein